MTASCPRSSYLCVDAAVSQLHPRGCVIARFFPASYISINARTDQSLRNRRVEKQVINAQTGVAHISISKVIPERIDLCVGMQDPYGIGPSLAKQSRKRFTHLDSEQGIVNPSLWFVYIPLCGNDVVIAGKDHWGTSGDELGGMSEKAIKPAQFVVEFPTRRRVAVGQIQATDYDAIDHRLDVATVNIIRIAGKCTPDLCRFGIPSQDSDPVPAFLSMPDRSVTRIPDRSVRKFLLGRLQFLKADHISRGLIKPAQQIGKARANAVYVVGNDSHLAYGTTPSRKCTVSFPRECSIRQAPGTLRSTLHHS